MLPILVQHRPRDRELMGSARDRDVGTAPSDAAPASVARSLRLHIAFDLYERICEGQGAPVVPILPLV